MAIGLLLGACAEQECPPSNCDPLDLDAAALEVEIAHMLAKTDTLDRHRRMIQLMDAIDEDNLSGAVAAYDEHVTRVDPHEARIFANRWARLDPHAAVEGILAWNYPRIKNQAVLEAVFVWTQMGGGDDARAYVDPLFEGNIDTRRSPTKFMFLAVLQGLGVAQEWDKLTDMLGSADDDGDRELWITEVMVEINRANGIEAVRAWLNSIPWDAPHNLKVSALKRGLHWVAGTGGGEKAAAWFEEFEDEPRAIEVLPMAVQTWGIREPGTAIDWLLMRQRTTVRDVLIREIVRGWLGRESEAETAEAWVLANLSIEPIATTTAIVYANHLVEKRRFAESADVVRGFAPVENRDRATAGVLVKWTEFDRAAVEAYIEEKNLSDDVVAEYTRRLKDKPVRVEKRRGQSGAEVQK